MCRPIRGTTIKAPAIAVWIFIIIYIFIFSKNLRQKSMWIKNLALTNFRNYERETFKFGEGVNVIVGDNGQGKTNSVEAVFLLATGYSPRVRRDKQVIRYGEEKAEIKAEAVSVGGRVSVELSYYGQGDKKIVINGIETKKVGEIFGNIYAVYFSPQELKLIQESPEDRRRFMDIAISELSNKYFYSLVKYKKIIEQRNKLLKNPDVDMVLDTLPIWDEQLAEYFADVVIARNDFIEKLAPRAKEAHLFITDGKERLDVAGGNNYFGSRNDMVRDIKLDLANNYRQDLALGFTSIGPHRDDLKITLNGDDVRVFGSQGQQRTAALSLKLAELEILKEHYHEYPVLILDDALSELDKTRQKRILEKVKGVQTLITCTEIDQSVFGEIEYKTFNIKNGAIIDV